MPFDWAELKRSFFDREAVVRRVDSGKRRVLSRMGAFVRTRSRSSIRYRRTISPPGQPPSSHSGELRLIFFAWDSRSESVVVGPVPFRAKRVGSAVVPRLLEHGGPGITSKGKPGYWRPRPFMAPALDHERPKFREQLRALWGAGLSSQQAA